MSRVVVLPPEAALREDGTYAGGWWHSLEGDDRIVCDLCPRDCHLKPGDRGFCFVRQNVGGEMVLTTYGRSTGFCIDPIEKKPLNHFLPGTSVLSFGTAGCNLGCKFCQNWDISKSRQVERLSELAGPEAIAEAAQHYGCRSVAYTYNDPIIWAEYAIDTAKACRAVGVKNVAVTAGYISPAARGPFYENMDAANVDLKSFSEEFYYRITYSHLQPVLETLEWLARETDVWVEITNLVIPQANDSLDEIRQMCDWILAHVGDGVPVHFTAFHPDFRMQDRPRTPAETLLAARQAALAQGLKFVYVGNVNDVVHQSTYCSSCQGLLIERNWYELGQYHLVGDRCQHCQQQIPGVFEEAPGSWGRKRQPVRIADFARPLPVISKPQEEPPDMSTPAKSEGVAARLRAQRPKLSDEQQAMVHHAASEIVAAAILKRDVSVPDPKLGGAVDTTVMGAFVTLKRNERLRACCGTLGQPMPLGRALQQAAARTATEDARLPPISPTELAALELDVSLLYGFHPIEAKGQDRVAAVEPGRHGLQIRRGENSGLLLPQVATEQGYGAEEFLRQLCRKANLPPDAWADDETVVQTFEALAIAGPFDKSTLEAAAPVSQVLSDAELKTLADHTARNLQALLQGATPSYYVQNCGDANVNGIAITLLGNTDGQAHHFFRMSMRPAMPLQATTFKLCEATATALRSGQTRVKDPNVRLAISILYDPAMHGTVSEPALAGLDSKARALLVLEGGKSAWVFDPSKSPEELLEVASEQIRVLSADTAAVFSLAAQSTEPAIVVSSAPRPVEGPEKRAAAVAGRFYPEDADELSKMVGEFLGGAKGRKKNCPAIMVPHAGLIYSGAIAGQVFSKVKIPSTVIVIGPKHTRLGVEWAVAPNDTWTIPGAELAADKALADKLVAAIPGLQLDAAAHAAEHGIEVELPFLAQLNPKVKVVGITIGGGDLSSCKRFATGLAGVMKEMDEPPLLVISSDMNHYATDEENRRLDEIAMQALERLDPDDLYSTVTGNSISMCGLLPAVIALETVKELRGLKSADRIAYGTSADSNGDKTRVVGYCGMTFA